MKTFIVAALFAIALPTTADHCQAQCRNGNCQSWYGGSATAVAWSGDPVVWKNSHGKVIAEHETIQRALKFINEDRARHGRQPLKIDPALCLNAQRHSEWMARHGQVHSNYPGMECIYCGPQNARDCVNGWIWSGAHHNIMLSGSRCGIGYSNRGRCSWTLIVH